MGREGEGLPETQREPESQRKCACVCVGVGVGFLFDVWVWNRRPWTAPLLACEPCADRVPESVTVDILCSWAQSTGSVGSFKKFKMSVECVLPLLPPPAGLEDSCLSRLREQTPLSAAEGPGHLGGRGVHTGPPLPARPDGLMALTVMLAEG